MMKKNNKVIQFIKNWTLPISMLSGALEYFVGAALPVSEEVSNDMLYFTELLQPVLLFCMLFISFCKVKPSDMRPHMWQLWLLLIQLGLFGLFTFILWLYPETHWRLTLEGTMLAFLCPTATACAVVTQKLGGDSAATTTYTIIINLAMAVAAPLLLPVAHPSAGVSFFPAFLIIIKKVFPLLMLPLFIAWFVRYKMPRFHSMVLATKDLAFYMWAVALAIAIAVTCRALAHSDYALWHVGGIALGSFIACVFQFWVGKHVGQHYGMRTEGGQALGQKNTVFIIWLGYTFLSPMTAVAGGFYSVWHNVINTYQLYKYRKNN